MRSDRLAEKTKRAAAFKTDCSRSCSWPRGYRRKPSCSSEPCWQSVHEPRSTRRVVTEIAARSGSDIEPRSTHWRRLWRGSSRTRQRRCSLQPRGRGSKKLAARQLADNTHFFSMTLVRTGHRGVAWVRVSTFCCCCYCCCDLAVTRLPLAFIPSKFQHSRRQSYGLWTFITEVKFKCKSK